MSKKAVICCHFLAIALMTVNAICWSAFDMGFVPGLNNLLYAFAGLSGLGLFVQHYRSTQRFHLYWSLYPLLMALLLLAAVIRGLFFGIIALLILFPADLDSHRFQAGDMRIYPQKTGLMSYCCQYELRQMKYGLLERRIGTFQTDQDINFREMEIEPNENGWKLTYKQDYYNDLTDSYQVENQVLQIDDPQ
ncbi:MAG: hypothetical protein AAFV95_10375 [Bacteroidota bacterium]